MQAPSAPEEIQEEELTTNKGGRPPKYNPERVDRFLTALRAGNTIRASSAYAGISEDTFGRWKKTYPEFADSFAKAEADAEVAHVANIAKAAKAGNWTASAWWLERRRPEDWGRKDRVLIEREAERYSEQYGVDKGKLVDLATKIAERQAAAS